MDYYSPYIPLHEQTISAVACIEASPCENVKSAVQEVAKKISQISVDSWDDSSKTKFNGNLTSCKSKLNAIINSINNVFKKSEEAYKNMNLQLDELKRVNDLLQAEYKNEPKRSEYWYQDGEVYNKEEKEYVPNMQFDSSRYNEDVEAWKKRIKNLENTCEKLQQNIENYKSMLEQMNGSSVTGKSAPSADFYNVPNVQYYIENRNNEQTMVDEAIANGSIKISEETSETIDQSVNTVVAQGGIGNTTSVAEDNLKYKEDYYTTKNGDMYFKDKESFEKYYRENINPDATEEQIKYLATSPNSQFNVVGGNTEQKEFTSGMEFATEQDVYGNVQSSATETPSDSTLTQEGITTSTTNAQTSDALKIFNEKVGGTLSNLETPTTNETSGRFIDAMREDNLNTNKIEQPEVQGPIKQEVTPQNSDVSLTEGIIGDNHGVSNTTSVIEEDNLKYKEDYYTTKNGDMYFKDKESFEKYYRENINPDATEEQIKYLATSPNSQFNVVGGNTDQNEFTSGMEVATEQDVYSNVQTPVTETPNDSTLTQEGITTSTTNATTSDAVKIFNEKVGGTLSNLETPTTNETSGRFIDAMREDNLNTNQIEKPEVQGPIQQEVTSQISNESTMTLTPEPNSTPTVAKTPTPSSVVETPESTKEVQNTIPTPGPTPPPTIQTPPATSNTTSTVDIATTITETGSNAVVDQKEQNSILLNTFDPNADVRTMAQNAQDTYTQSQEIQKTAAQEIGELNQYLTENRGQLTSEEVQTINDQIYLRQDLVREIQGASDHFGSSRELSGMAEIAGVIQNDDKVTYRDAYGMFKDAPDGLATLNRSQETYSPIVSPETTRLTDETAHYVMQQELPQANAKIERINDHLDDLISIEDLTDE